MGRVKAVGLDYVIYQMGTEQFVRRGAHQLAGLSVHFASKGLDAERIVVDYDAQFSELERAAHSSNKAYADVLDRLPFLRDLSQIAEDLAKIDFPPAQVLHYALQIVSPKASENFFWNKERSPRDEYALLIRQLHPNHMFRFRESTRVFANEVFARATAAGRTLRGFSEKSSRPDG